MKVVKNIENQDFVHFEVLKLSLLLMSRWPPICSYMSTLAFCNISVKKKKSNLKHIRGCQSYVKQSLFRQELQCNVETKIPCFVNVKFCFVILQVSKYLYFLVKSIIVLLFRYKNKINMGIKCDWVPWHCLFY